MTILDGLKKELLKNPLTREEAAEITRLLFLWRNGTQADR